jgi:hypothetical protein
MVGRTLLRLDPGKAGDVADETDAFEDYDGCRAYHGLGHVRQRIRLVTVGGLLGWRGIESRGSMIVRIRRIC